MRLSAAGILAVAFCLLSAGSIAAQNSKGADKIVPFTELLDRPVTLKQELRGVHPRLFFTAKDLPELRDRSKGTGRELWIKVVEDLRSMKRDVPDPSDPELYKSGLEQKKGSISQYSFAFAIAETTFAYAIEQDEKHFQKAKEWTLAACDMPMWGYTYNKPNVDLPPAHLLYAVALAYDVLYDKLTTSEKDIIRAKLLKQGRLMYDYFKYKPGKRYTFSQNHTWIPMAGLAMAAYVLMDEEPETQNWARLSRAVFDRTIQTFGTDGYFYESFHYLGFAFRWTIRYFDAHLSVTGENLYEVMKPKLLGVKYYAMHSILPDGKNVFDFADTGDGSLNRNGISKRESLYAEYDMIYRLAAVFNDPQAQAIGDFIRTRTELETREPMWAFINRNPRLKPAELSEIPLQHYFEDNDTVFWRSDWTPNATAFAFRSAPPEGHHAARLAARIPEWRQNTGHGHPDANSFIIWANGKYLTGDTGYLGIKQTDDHNTILVNGRGQEKDGVYEMFKGVPNDRLDKIRIAETWGNGDYFYARGEAASGYYSDLDLKKFDRHFLYIAPDYFVVWDQLETEKPAKFTFLLNADREINLQENIADLVNGDAGLKVIRVLPFKSDSEVVPQTVQARGLPGSVDKGNSEQRGMQFRTTAAAEQNYFEFLHVLIPYATIVKPTFPEISNLSNGEQGLKLRFKNGSVDIVCLTGTCADIASDGGRVIARRNAGGLLERLIWHDAATVRVGEIVVMSSAEKISGSLQLDSRNRISAFTESDAATELKLVKPIEPKSIQVNGQPAKYSFDSAAQILTISLPSGTNVIKSE